MMNVKKSLISYFIWILFVIVDCLCLSFYLVTGFLSKKFEQTTWITVGVCAAFLFLLVFFIIVRKISNTITQNRVLENDEKDRMDIRGIVFPILILIGAAGRLTFYLFYHIPIVIRDGTFYYQAEVTNSHNGLIFSLHGLTAEYINALHILFLFFGNDPLAGIIFQMVLFFCSLLLFYFTVKTMSGILPACIAMACMAFLPAGLSNVFSLTPELLSVFMFLTGFWLLGRIIKAFSDGNCNSIRSYVLFLFVGAYFGILTYLDLYNIMLMLLTFTLYQIGQEKKKQIQALLLITCIAIGFVLGIASVAGVLVLIGQNIFSYIIAWIDLYFGTIQLNYLPIAPESTILGSLFLLTIAFFNIPGYVTQRRSRSGGYMLCLIAAMVLPILSINYIDYQLQNTLLWSALAGLGIQALLMREKMVQVKAGEEAVLEAGFESLDDYEADQVVAGGEKEELTTILSTDSTQISDDTPVVLLDNPLPLPKRHIRREMNYSKDVAEDFMRFDHEISDEDDYDYIK